MKSWTVLACFLGTFFPRALGYVSTWLIFHAQHFLTSIWHLQIWYITTRESRVVFQVTIWRAECSEERVGGVALLLLEYSCFTHKGFSQALTGRCCVLNLCRFKRAKLVAKNKARNCNLLCFPVVNSGFGKRVFFLKDWFWEHRWNVPDP